jgi:PhnB protein
MAKLNLYLNFAGNTEEAFNLYKSVFGGEFTSVVRFKDMSMEGVSIPEEDENKIMHIGLPIGKDNVLMATDTLESLGQKLTQGNRVFRSKPLVPLLELPLDPPPAISCTASNDTKPPGEAARELW